MHSLEKSLQGLWSFSLKCARRLSETQTLPSEPLRGRRPQVESPLLLPLGGGHPNLQVTASLCLLCIARCHPKGGEKRKQFPLMEANEDGLGGLLNLSWNVCTQGAGPVLVWNEREVV